MRRVGRERCGHVLVWTGWVVGMLGGLLGGSPSLGLVEQGAGAVVLGIGWIVVGAALAEGGR